ncbi:MULTISPECIES: Lrp/AsnC ligand binding domain-containing protein [unclassified Mesorhizobium]|uniref:Lrp/AsnC ligand binding domain-containing protein n=1 Tax=unclassified Mesorhizobium TaxID=325217 RepID=UPI0003CEF0F9|nr:MULTISPECIES: Lrp/AsnC ligand binding domain-containing protein [unclassified Mesorhizobium]ESX31294.1 ArsR family transcriptional regulator [Mesorhizobium sp. LSHC440A00]
MPAAQAPAISCRQPRAERLREISGLDLVDDFKGAMRAAKEVTQCYMITGDADFVLIVAVEDVDAFDVFVKTKLYTNPNVRKFKSMIALDRVKFEPRVLV